MGATLCGRKKPIPERAKVSFKEVTVISNVKKIGEEMEKNLKQ